MVVAMATAKSRIGYVFHTGASAVDSTKFQQLVTLDSPSAGSVVSSCIGRQGPYFLSIPRGEATSYIHVLPVPGGTTDVPYADAPKMEYQWKSKKFVMPGRTTWGAAKVVYNNGCLRIRVYVDGCCEYDSPVDTCMPFRLPSQLAGMELEIELIGTATVYEVHVASTIRELTQSE